MGKRARIPTEKAAMAQENAKKGGGGKKKKDSQVPVQKEACIVAEVVSEQNGSNGLEMTQLEELQIVEHLEESPMPTETIIETTIPLSMGNSEVRTRVAVNMGNSESKTESSRRLSWADEVEAELETRPSVWDNFSITKISNAGFKLDYVAPELHEEVPVCEIDLENISSEILYWKNVIVCYVLGAHPPFSVLNGFVQRQWAKHGINKVSMLKNEIVLVRFESEIGKNEVLQGGIYHFDNKSFIVKAWNPDMEFIIEELYTVPIWVKLPGLDFKYWGPKRLSKIGSLIGKPLMVDRNTEKKIGLNCVKLLIEVDIDTPLPEKVFFRSKRGYLLEQKVSMTGNQHFANFVVNMAIMKRRVRRRTLHPQQIQSQK
ncbi:uncharacterized protein LOC132046996 isoform X1 [Lycium ferocissimum]|uniref:uncharacterized protein LOC132046996 isoform X1 n=1 Tax=Lycium ferocissimum TaxID=112874 RepID=UPI0028163E8B|nr:uncharacterized protein LOC132046996 isoform X1 [Lycium ferocissimum]